MRIELGVNATGADVLVLEIDMRFCFHFRVCHLERIAPGSRMKTGTNGKDVKQCRRLTQVGLEKSQYSRQVSITAPRLRFLYTFPVLAVSDQD